MPWDFAFRFDLETDVQHRVWSRRHVAALLALDVTLKQPVEGRVNDAYAVEFRGALRGSVNLV